MPSGKESITIGTIWLWHLITSLIELEDEIEGEGTTNDDFVMWTSWNAYRPFLNLSSQRVWLVGWDLTQHLSAWNIKNTHYL